MPDRLTRPGLIAFLALVPDAALAVDQSGTIVATNELAESLFLYPEGGLIGLAVEELVPERLVDLHRHHRCDYHRDPRRRPMGIGLELSGRRRDGVEVPVDVSLAPLATTTGMVTVAAVRDISERRRNEEALHRLVDELQQANQRLEAADRLRDELLAITSHELRTPLTTIIGFATTLMGHWDRIPPHQRHEQLDAILRQAMRLSRLVADLLMVSRLEAGVVHPTPTRVAVADAIDQAIDEARPQTDGVKVDCPPELRVNVDADHLRQILLNLLTNAAKYGKPPVHVSAAPVDGMVELRVCDAGTGVPTELLPRLFQRYAHGTNAVKGVGLGLNIVSGLAKAQGGSVHYEPVDPHGACFLVRLPAG